MKKTPIYLPIIRRIKESGRVQHTTINLTGPGGVARLHLTPSKFSLRPLKSMLIVNGVYRLPLDSGPAAMMRIFISTMNRLGDDKKEISSTRVKTIVESTIKSVRRLYPDLTMDAARAEFEGMMNVILRLAKNEPIGVEEAGYTMEEWAKIAAGPERMDLMVMPVKRNGRRACNADCNACYAQELETAEISTWQWKRIIFRLKYCGVSQITFTGGEPTLRKDLPELVAAAKWYVTRLNTNGFRLTSELVASLVRADLDMIQITFYSVDEKIHNLLMGRLGAYGLSRQGIINAIRGGLNVSINVPIMAQNANTFPDTIRMLHQLGVRYMTCSGLIPTGGAKALEAAGDTLTEKALYETLKAGFAVANNLGVDVQFTSPGQLSDAQLKELGLAVPTCGAGLSNMAIRPDGQVVPCQSWGHKPVGSMFWKPWASIWNHPVVAKIRTHYALHNACPLKEEE